MTETPDPRTVLIDAQQVPLDECIWLERRPCGCVLSAALAVVRDEWTIATTEQAAEHFNRMGRSPNQSGRNGVYAEAVTNDRYRRNFTGRWRCDQHTA